MAPEVALRHTRSLPDLERRRPKHRQLRTKQLIQVNRTETDEGLCATALIEAFEKAAREKKRLEKEAAERESRLKKQKEAAAQKKKARGIMKRRTSVLQQPATSNAAADDASVNDDEEEEPEEMFTEEEMEILNKAFRSCDVRKENEIQAT